jgi:hypothetical protein
MKTAAMADVPDIDPTHEFDVRIVAGRTPQLVLMRRWGGNGAWEDCATFHSVDVGAELLLVLRAGMAAISNRDATVPETPRAKDTKQL